MLENVLHQRGGFEHPPHQPHPACAGVAEGQGRADSRDELPYAVNADETR